MRIMVSVVVAAVLAGFPALAPAGPDEFDSRPARSNQTGGSASDEGGSIPGAVLPADATLSDFLAFGAFHNPGLEAAFYEWRAALERIPQVIALPDPRFTYRYFIQEVETRVGPQKQAVGLSQAFPWLGKLALRGDVAAERARIVQAKYEATRLALFREIKDGYYEYYYLIHAISVVRENRDLVAYLEEVARSRYKAAVANQAEVIRAQVELGKLEDRLRALEDLVLPTVARLNAAMNRPIDAPLPLPGPIVEQDLQATDEQVIAWAIRNNPHLWALAHEIEKNRLAIELARKDSFPDITLGLDYTNVGSPPSSRAAGLRNPAAVRSLSRMAGGMGDAIDLYTLGRSFQPGSRPNDAGDDIWMVSVSMNIPIRFDKYAAGEREASAKHRASRANRLNRENALAARVRRVLYEFRDALRKIDLYRDTLVPKARQNVRATEAAYRAGKASFLDLVDAQRAMLDFQLSAERALATHAQKLAELEMIVGRELPHEASDSSKSVSPDPEGATQPQGSKP